MTTQRATVLPFNWSHYTSGEPIVPKQQQRYHPWGEILLAWECVPSDSSGFTLQRTSTAYIWWRFLCCYPEYADELTFSYLVFRYSYHFVNSVHGYWHTHRLSLAGAEQQVTDLNRCYWLRYISLTAWLIDVFANYIIGYRNWYQYWGHCCLINDMGSSPQPEGEAVVSFPGR